MQHQKNLPFFIRMACVLIISFILSSCGSSKSSGDDNTTETGITGVVKDVDGNGIAGVTVTVGTTTTATESDGSYQIEVSEGNDQIVTFSQEGYVIQSRFINIYSEILSYQPVFLMAEEESQALDADSGGTILGPRNASLTVPSFAFVDSLGNPVIGEVEIALTPFDPSDETEVAMFPGDLRGITIDGETVPLISYGILDVVVRQNGEDLQVQSGAILELEIPAIAQEDNPETISIWTLDTEDGIWHENEEEGTYDPLSNTYVTTVSHLSPFNTDKPFDPACVRGIVEDEEGNTISGARVTAQPVVANASVYSSTFTDEQGSYCMTVQRDLPAIISVLTDDGSVTKRTIQGGTTRSISYPASCSQDSCQQLYTIVVETPDTGQDSSEEANCPFSGEPFDGACDSGLDNFVSCFSPEGLCTSDLDFINGELDFSFENGSRINVEADSVTGSSGTVYYGPTGVRCGTLSFSTDGITATITLSSGLSVETTITETGATQVTCPDGDTVLFSGSQQDAWRGCTGSTANNVGGVPCEPAPGSFGYACTSDNDCDLSGGNLCCGRYDGNKLCLPSLFCSLYDNSSCRTSDDCDSSNVCCSAGYFSLCLPLDQCL